MSTVTIVQAIQDIVFDLAGIRDAPDYPPDQINAPLTAVTYAGSGAFRPASLAAPGCYEVTPCVFITLLLLPQKDMAREVETLLPYVDSLPVALLENGTLSATVDCVDEVTYQFVTVTWGGVEMRGYRFETRVSRKAQQYS